VSSSGSRVFDPLSPSAYFSVLFHSLTTLRRIDG
jgi:hypothetical protein